MKKIIILLAACLYLASCTKIISGIGSALTPTPQISFEVNGEEYRFKSQDEVGTFKIMKVSDTGFAISFVWSSWNTSNTLDDAELYLNCGFFNAKFKKGEEYAFTDEEMDACPSFSYTGIEYLEPLPEQTTQPYLIRTYWYNATNGWFKITKINAEKGVISGRFEYTAVCDDPSNQDVVEVTNGVFKDISYVIVED